MSVAQRQKVARCLAFAHATDDGKKPHLHSEADVVILGLSGSGKSVVCRKLARLGVKAANIPFVTESDERTAPTALVQLAAQQPPVLIVGLNCTQKNIIEYRSETYRWHDAAIWNAPYLANQNAYGTDPEVIGFIREEIRDARNLFNRIATACNANASAKNGFVSVEAGSSPQIIAQRIIDLLHERHGTPLPGYTPEYFALNRRRIVFRKKSQALPENPSPHLYHQRNLKPLSGLSL